jgi:CheY-like chemotaxis protein
MTKKVILCVDDEKTILMSLKAQLKYCFGDRFQYEVAESAAEAWEVIEELSINHQTIALIISDWLMPEVKGDEFLIQVHQKYPDIVKMMLTGMADPDAISRTEKYANLACCLSKPWTKEALASAIDAEVK